MAEKECFEVTVKSRSSSKQRKGTRVSTAIKFLLNPQVIGSPPAQKQSFLRKKGLTEAEIETACRRAEISEITFTHQNGGSSWMRFRSGVSSFLIFVASAYSLYQLYKTFICPLIFGEKKKRDDELSKLCRSLESAVTRLNTSVDALKVTVDSSKCDSDGKIREVKNEMASIKGLLLGRKQFPSPLPVGPVSIPDWQKVTPEEVNEETSSDEKEL